MTKDVFSIPETLVIVRSPVVTYIGKSKKNHVLIQQVVYAAFFLSVLINRTAINPYKST